MIGKIYSFVTPYYDIASQQNKFKKRPVLIIGIADTYDYNVLPISKVSHREYLDIDYDMPIDPTQYPLLGLNIFSYVRVHKQTFANRASLGALIGDMKTNYVDMYLTVLSKLEDYNSKIINDALL